MPLLYLGEGMRSLSHDLQVKVKLAGERLCAKSEPGMPAPHFISHIPYPSLTHPTNFTYSSSRSPLSIISSTQIPMLRPTLYAPTGRIQWWTRNSTRLAR